MRLFFLRWIITAVSIAPNSYAADNKNIELDANIQEGLRSGQYVVLLRHALAPGFGDPSEFDVNDCGTQRNLSEQGRKQARGIGKLLKNNGIQQATVFSSQWCGCLETARLLDVGEVSELPIINSFFRHYGRKSEQTQQLKKWLIKNRLSHKDSSSPPIILVTHQVNITALTGIFPSSGELVIIEADESGAMTVVAQLETDN